MIWSIAAFEVKKRLRMFSTYIYFVAFFACALLTMLASGGAFSIVWSLAGSEKILANAPLALNNLVAILSNFGVLITAAVFGQAVHQDHENRCDSLFFTTLVDKTGYLGGRFLGALLFALLVFSGIGLGLWAGTVMPFVDRSLFGPNRWAHYIWPYVCIVISNVAFTGAIFFALATLLRKMTPVYTGAVILVIGYLMAGPLTSNLEYKTLGGLIDPFGTNAVNFMTEYWTVVEKNTLLVPLQGVLLGNRILWIGIGLALFALTLRRFRFTHSGTPDRARAADAKSVEPAGLMPNLRPQPERGLMLLLARLTWLSFKETVKNVYFGVIVLAGVLFIFVMAWQSSGFYDGTTYPVTYSMLDLTGGVFYLFVLIIITFYSGELVWRERDARMEQISDALPTPTWLPFLSKLFSLMLVQVVLLGVIMASGLVIQTLEGYHHYELGLYLQELFGLQLIHYCLLCVLAIAVQTLVQNKYMGHFIMVLYYLWTLFAARLGLGHNLYNYAGTPEYTYSDMNGYGHFLRSVFWFDFYWAAFALLLAFATHLFWARGRETGFQARLPEAKRRFSPRLRLASVCALAVFAGVGAFIFYNTNVVNQYQTSHDREAEQADYEKSYKHVEKTAQPRITEVNVAFDLFPGERRLRARGTYTLENKTTQVIKTVYVDNEPTDRTFHKLAIGANATPTHEDPRLNFYTFELKQPLHPGDTVTLEFDVDFQTHGFKNENELQWDILVENGTFFVNGYLPIIGYRQARELFEDNVRKKFGLAPQERMPDLNDPEGLKVNGTMSDWLTFEATVSTSPDQIAVTPGYLQREWLENGRRYFHYKMDSPILNNFVVLSARYAVKRDNWKGVALEIYYHPGHEYNLERMMQSMKDALDYCTTHFGPYQHRQLRILEFPRYQTVAAALPNTIPYSESIGFIWETDPQDPQAIDVPYYVTAHEVAHQWWGGQVVGGQGQGNTMLSESMAQYTALMVMKKTFGPQNIRRFLQHELDSYLTGRGLERKKELPLLRVEGQPYIHYQKGSLVMYALQDYIGEDNLNRALASYASRVKFQPPPYTNSLELLGYIKEATPPELQYVLADMFENITLYDNRASSATYRKLDDGRYEVKLQLAAKKLRADGLGTEREVPLNDLVDIGALDASGAAIAIEKRWLKSNQAEVTLMMNRPPVTAGIDPLNKLVDRKPDDNVIRAVQQE